MIWIRSLAIASNCAFIVYGHEAELPPILILHAILLPINAFRLWQAGAAAADASASRSR
jgi:CRP/FNR family cyclic AMP-dependent transcriptional regulator